MCACFLYNADFSQAVSRGDVVCFGKRRVVENRRPEVVDSSALAHHNLQAERCSRMSKKK